MTDRDLFGKAIRKEPVQQRLNLSMGVTIRWGRHGLRVSKDPACGSIVVSPVDLPDLGPRWAQALKVLYPGRKPGELNHKRCANALRVSPRTAEGWAAGQEPSGKHLWAALKKHGRGLLTLIAPELAPPTAIELVQAAERLCATSADLAAAIAVLAKGGGDVDG